MDTQEARPDHYTGSGKTEQPRSVSASVYGQAVEPAHVPERTTSHRPASYDRGVQTAAAKVRLVTDRRLGNKTPAWIKKLAAEKPASHAS
jgi:hypothetical protein